MQMVSQTNEGLQNRRTKQRGFTLIEILIAMAIVALLTGLVGIKVMDQFKKAKVDAAKVQIANYTQALQAYYLAHNMYPQTAQGLDSLVKKPSVGKIPENYPDGGYLSKKKIDPDPWGHPYVYNCEDYQTFSVFSNGPDGVEGTDDDIKGGE